MNVTFDKSRYPPLILRVFQRSMVEYPLLFAPLLVVQLEAEKKPLSKAFDKPSPPSKSPTLFYKQLIAPSTLSNPFAS